jgi:hypothetical protein
MGDLWLKNDGGVKQCINYFLMEKKLFQSVVHRTICSDATMIIIIWSFTYHLTDKLRTVFYFENVSK